MLEAAKTLDVANLVNLLAQDVDRVEIVVDDGVVQAQALGRLDEIRVLVGRDQRHPNMVTAGALQQFELPVSRLFEAIAQ